jgi:hypothetical protein
VRFSEQSDFERGTNNQSLRHRNGVDRERSRPLDLELRWHQWRHDCKLFGVSSSNDDDNFLWHAYERLDLYNNDVVNKRHDNRDHSAMRQWRHSAHADGCHAAIYLH